MKYVFTWAGMHGPCVRRFDDARSLLAYACGWQGSCSEAERDAFLLLASPSEIRA